MLGKKFQIIEKSFKINVEKKLKKFEKKKIEKKFEKILKKSLKIF